MFLPSGLGGQVLRPPRLPPAGHRPGPIGRRAEPAGRCARARRGRATSPRRSSDPSQVSQPECRPAAAGAGTSTCPTGAPRCSSASTSTWSAARSSRCSAPTAPASPPCCPPSPAWPSPGGGSVALRRHRHHRRRRPPRPWPTAWCSCPAARACSPPSPSPRTSISRRGCFKGEPEYVSEVTEQVLEIFPILRRATRPEGRQPLRRRAADAHARPGVHLAPEPADDRRAEPRAGAGHRRAAARASCARSTQTGTTIVLVEQSVNVAITLADRAVFLEKGEVRFDGPTAELLERPEILRAVFLEGATKATGDIECSPRRTASAPKAAFEPVCAHCGHEHPVALDVDGLSVNFGGVQAVRDVSASRCGPARSSASSGRTVPARPPCSTSSPGSSRPPPAALALERHDVTDAHARRPRARSAWVARSRTLVCSRR